MFRRSLGTAAFFAFSACASAQLGAFKSTTLGIRKLQELQLVPGPTQQPLQPAGHPGLEPKVVPDKKLPAAPNPEQKFELIKAGRPDMSGAYMKVTDGVEFRYRGYHITADEAEGDRRTNVFILSGHVQVVSKDSVVTGEKVVVDLDNETYRSYDAESQISPRLVGGQIRDEVYVKGQESFGSRNETRTLFGDFTTCNYERPHYDIEGEDIVVRPGRRAIFRRAKIRLFGRTMLRLPFLSIPLDDRTYNNLPTVGQSPDEGYYIKTRFAFPLKGRSELQTRLDYMTKLGLGYGANYIYNANAIGGYLRFYSVSGMSDTLNVSNEHRQQFRWGSLTVNTDYQQNNYLTAPQSTLMQNRATLTLPQKYGSTRLGYNRVGNQTLGYSTTTQSFTVSDQRTVAKSIRTSADVNYTTSEQNYQGQTSQNREQVDLSLRATDELPKGTATLEYQRSIPIGENTNFFGGSDRTPVFSFASDSRRLMGQKFDKQFPFRTDLSIGEYQNLTGNGHVGRGSFNLNFNKYDQSQSRLKVNYNGQFKQGIYSDDTAQYVLNLGTTVSYRLGRDTAANVRYNYLRPYGYSPLLLDRTGKTNLASVDVSYRPIRSLLLGVQTGYDISRLETQDIPWQQVGLRTEFRQGKWFQFRTLSTYDTFQQQWSSVRLDFGYQPGATLVTVGARYDGIRQTWSNANIFINDLRMGKAKLSAILTYNGYTKEFDSQQYSMIYDLHCAEAIMTWTENNSGFRAGREIQFFVRLKAFPFNSIFGVGPRGEPIGTGTGSDF